MAITYTRVLVDMGGILQGVGFRPKMLVLAERAGLTGWVQNRSGTVRMSLEGSTEAIESFFQTLPTRLPKRARLDQLDVLESEPLSEGGVAPSFEILESPIDGADDKHAAEAYRISIPADLALCEDCRAEVFDSASRYFGYAFTACTNCGPRYSVVTDMPYDRAKSTLRDFPLCETCLEGYRDVRDRRFHAESIACPECGPQLSLIDADGEPITDGQRCCARSCVNQPCSEPWPYKYLSQDQACILKKTRAALSFGDVVAIRGIGGFLLAVDAFDEVAIATLRARKNRPDKPFAVMARNLEVAQQYCDLPDSAVEQMTSPSSPICIAPVKREALETLTTHSALSPDGQTLGMMLPTTPIHELLFQPLPGDDTPAFDLLVMTSGNRGGEPICIKTNEALERLRGIADLFLTHNREINLRCDDSLCAIVNHLPQVWRRGRGFAPDSFPLHRALQRNVLAMGAELKNAIAIGFGCEAVFSPHVGDLATPEALDGLEQVVETLPDYFRQQPEVIAVDAHPDMHATRMGRRVAGELGVPVVEVQHHVAHAAAAMAEHGLDETLALAFDGTGLGTDGTIWGAELLHLGGHSTPSAVSASSFPWKRLGTFDPAPLPGGDAAVQHPVRQVIARLAEAGCQVGDCLCDAMGTTCKEASMWRMQCARGLNAPLTHAAGRVFDSYSTLLGLSPEFTTYEGQPAVRLEDRAWRGLAARGAASASAVPFAVRSDDEGLLLIDWQEAFGALSEARGLMARGGRFSEADEQSFALGFHQAMARAAVAMAEHGCAQTGVRDLVLTGGVWMNRLLNQLAVPALREAGFRVHLHRQVPPNDGGVALGQLAIAGGLFSCV
ncbi:MAG: carbamoyltransferase HypF [Planctomycetes bacterium]|nr:carbamoyltransferase HypF [Planctomycetota bacterium]